MLRAVLAAFVIGALVATIGCTSNPETGSLNDQDGSLPDKASPEAGGIIAYSTRMADSDGNVQVHDFVAYMYSRNDFRYLLTDELNNRSMEVVSVGDRAVLRQDDAGWESIDELARAEDKWSGLLSGFEEPPMLLFEELIETLELVSSETPNGKLYSTTVNLGEFDRSALPLPIVNRLMLFESVVSSLGGGETEISLEDDEAVTLSLHVLAGSPTRQVRLDIEMRYSETGTQQTIELPPVAGG